ncbi:MAG: DUF2141 domain-containing protein [Bacteroidia bacterium]
MEKASSAEGHSIQINLSGIRNSNGHILVSLFNKSEGWPDNPDNSFKKLRIPATAGTMTLKFDARHPENMPLQ